MRLAAAYPMTHRVKWGGVSDPKGKEKFRHLKPSSQNLHLPIYDSTGDSAYQRFRVYRITY